MREIFHSRAPKGVYRILLAAVIMFINAIITNGIIIPNEINSGGIGGISLICNHTIAIPVWLTTGIANIIIFCIGFKQIGIKFGLISLVILLANVTGLYLTENMPPLITNEIITALIGSAVVGISVGIVFELGYSIGGISMVVFILKNRYGKTAGFYDNIINCCIMLLMLPFFKVEKFVLSLAFLFICNFFMNGTIKILKNVRSVINIKPR
jgi:uncharacterized membrane-anchored protein YitT (DUF2179 family)